MSMYRELLYDSNVSKVRGVQFCVLSPQDILQRSVVEVTRTETYAGNEPCDNGLFDVRMGTMELGKRCATCEQSNIFCPGHFGHVVLAKPVFYTKFLPMVIEILKCICFRCSKLLVDVASPEVQALQSRRCSRQKRWEAMSKLCQKAKTCPCCRQRQPDKIRENESAMVRLEWRDADNATSGDRVLSAEEVLRIFRRVSEEDGEAIGFSGRFNRPEWLICTVLPVPPPAVRPSVRNDTGQRSEDDLTHILSEIVKFNNVLRSKIERGATYEAVMFTSMMLQYHVSTLVDNSAPTMYVTSKDRTGRQLRTLVERLKSKEGRIRGNLMGKRVDFSARTVITPDPNLSIEELGVPIQIAMNLTFPEVVHAGNLEEMRQLVRNGPDTYPGAKHVRKAKEGMRTVRLKGNTTPNLEDMVEIGDVVERHLTNGYYVLFNRQPSLHKMSMMAHRVRVMPGKSFRLNVCVCSSYNADFDGDEMNMHVPQSHQTHEEIKHLAAVQLHIVSPRHGKPIIMPVQDVTLGAFLMTQPDVVLRRSQFMNLTCSNPLYSGAVPPPLTATSSDKALASATPAERELVTGRQLMSTVVPAYTNMNFGGVVVHDGQIQPASRPITSKVYSEASQGLVHSVYADKGPDVFTTFINNTQKLVCDWLVLSGFSVGVSDLVLRPEVRSAIQGHMVRMKDAVYQRIQELHDGKFENKSTRNNAEFFESQIISALSRGFNDAQKEAMASFDPGQNRMLNMIKAGSKGSDLNFSQMVSAVGQQLVDDKRVTDGYDNRSLPHFTKFDDGPTSRGFVENSFTEGLSPHEFFFHAMGGRVGLIDTAVKTSETGYIQRKLVKSMEDCKVHHDGTVRNAAGQVVQFLYGEDGADAAKVEYQYLPYLDAAMAGEDALRDAYLIAHTRELAPHVRPEVMQAALADAEADEEGGEGEAAAQEALLRHYQRIKEDRRYVQVHVHGKTERRFVVFPVNVERMVVNAAQAMAKYGNADGPRDLDPLYVLREVEALERQLRVGLAAQRDPATGDMVSAGVRVPLMGVVLRAFLSPKRLIVHHRLDRLAFDRVVQRVRATFYASLVNPGEVVGVTAAQSLGEPTTQLSSLSTSRLLINSRGAGDTRGHGDLYSGPIGQFIDAIIERNADKVVHLEEESVVLDLGDDEQHEIVGVDNDEKTSWKRISQVSRHPAKGGMVRIYTKSNKTTCATLSHSFLKRTADGIEPIRGQHLKVGDRVPVTKHIPTVAQPMTEVRIGDRTYPLTRDIGWLFGVYLADGSINNDVLRVSKIIPEFQEKVRTILEDVFGATMQQRHYRGQGVLHGYDMTRYNSTDNYARHAHLCSFLLRNFSGGSHGKRMPAFVYASNLDFIRGVIGGYFDGDGNVNDMKGKQMIRSASVSEDLTDDIILLLAYVDIFASKCRESHLKEQGRNDLYSVQIPRKYAPKFKEEVGLVVHSKATALNNVIDYVNRDDAHSSREEIDMIPELGDTLSIIGKTLKMEGQSREFGRFAKKEAIGRETLRGCIIKFDAAATDMVSNADDVRDDNIRRLQEMRDILAQSQPNSRRQIPMTERLSDDLKNVGESTKMLQSTKPGGEHARAAKKPSIDFKILERYINDLTTANVCKHRAVHEAVSAVQPHLTKLRQAADADVVWDEIVRLEHLDDPGEMVYDFTVPGNDSFMVDCGVLVHNTLNSVHYDEELLLAVDGKLRRTKIGDFTHQVIETAAPDAIEQHPHDTELGWVRGQDVKVMAVDQDGRVDWQTVEAVTRHPVVNEDGSDKLLHVRTRTGREVRATRGRSFLKRFNNKLEAINGSDLRVGDRVPVSSVSLFRQAAPIDTLDLQPYLSPAEYVYMSHIEAALRVKAEGKRTWFDGLRDRGIVVPYARSDIMLAAFVGTPAYPATRSRYCKSGHVYANNRSKPEDVQHIPERMPLDEDFGFLCGMYLADGCIAVGRSSPKSAPRPYAVLICNMSREFRFRVDRFCEKYNIGYHVDASTRLMKSGNRSPTVSIRMHSLLLGELFMRLFGQGAEVKRIDPVLFGSPDEFARGLLDGYWSGDGCVSERAIAMTAYSVSHNMLLDIQQLMARFDIPTSLIQQSERVYEQNLQKHDTCCRGWTLRVPACGVGRFRDIIGLTLERKRQRLEDKGDIDNTHAVYDVVPDVRLSTGTIDKINRSRIPFILEGAIDEEDRKVLQQILDEGVFYDEVVSIEEVPNEGRDRAYDLTVSNAHTFALYNGMYVPNTFHYSGVGSGASGSLLQGVPRLRELFNVSKNIKTPAMQVAVLREFATDRDKCAEIMNGIQTARFRDVVKSSRIYFDPSDSPDRTLIGEDRDLLRLHAAYADFMGAADGCGGNDRRRSPWLLRFEFDRAEMLKLNVFFTDIEFALGDHFDDEVSCIFSDDNADKLVCRLRLNVSNDTDRNDILTEVMALEQATLDNVVIRGVKDIQKAVLQPPPEFNKVYDDVTGTFVARQEWKIVTAGTNLVDVMAHPYVDYVNTTTNDIVEILRVLGIEAARNALYSELQAIMWMAKDNNVNHRHMALLVDTITNRGHLVSIDRHGINKGDIGPLAKCSFEETDKMLIKAGLFCELDKINGVSANIMLGQVPPCGTGDGDVIMDLDAITSRIDPPPPLSPSQSDNTYATSRREAEDAEAIRAAVSAATATTPSSTTTPNVSLPEKDANIVEKQEDDIVIV